MILFRRMSFSHTIQCESIFSFKERSFILRYESFYPFARNQSHSPPPRQPGSGFPPFSGPIQNQMNQPSQPNQFRGRGPGQSTRGQSPGPGSSKMESYMQTANQFMNTAQQYAPVVQQFAPMMRNLPAMWRLYKGFQSLPSAGEQATGGIAGQGLARATAQSTVSNTGPQPSIPRIFQPPGR